MPHAIASTPDENTRPDTKNAKKKPQQKRVPKRPRLPYINPSTARQYNYFIVPKMLISDDSFEDIDCAGKLMYSIMLNRLSLSAEHPDQYTDGQGRLFIVFPVEEMMKALHLSKPTVTKMLNQLEEHGLIVRKRQGLGKPSLIYVMDFTAAVDHSNSGENSGSSASNESSCQRLKTCLSGRKESFPLEVKKTSTRKNDLSKNDIRNDLPPQPEIYHKEDRATDLPLTRDNSETRMGMETALEELTEDVKDQIEYEVLVERWGSDVAKSVLSLITSVLARGGPVTMGRNVYPEGLVKDRFRSLCFEDVDYALARYYETPEVKNRNAYLTTLLFNSVGGAEMEAQALYAKFEGSSLTRKVSEPLRL